VQFPPFTVLAYDLFTATEEVNTGDETPAYGLILQYLRTLRS